MASSRTKNKVLQILYKPGKSKSSGVTFKTLAEMEKSLDSAVGGLKGKKKKDDEDEEKSG